MKLEIIPLLFNLYDRTCQLLVKTETETFLATYQKNRLIFYEQTNTETEQKNNEQKNNTNTFEKNSTGVSANILISHNQPKFVNKEIFTSIKNHISNLFKYPETAFDFFPQNEKIMLLFIHGETGKILFMDKEIVSHIRKLIEKKRYKYSFAINYQKKTCTFMEGNCANCERKAIIRVFDKNTNTFKLFCNKCYWEERKNKNT